MSVLYSYLYNFIEERLNTVNLIGTRFVVFHPKEAFPQFQTGYFRANEKFAVKKSERMKVNPASRTSHPASFDFPFCLLHSVEIEAAFQTRN